MTTRTVTLSDVELVVDEAGPGGRPLILVHGFCAGWVDFETTLEDLAARGWHAVAPDLRGHGASSKPLGESSYSLDIFARDVLALADALGFEHFVILGHSMGGMVAQRIALLAPERVDALIAMCTSHGPLAADRTGVEVAARIAREQGIEAISDVMEVSALARETEAYRRVAASDSSFRARRNQRRRACSAAMYAAMVVEMVDQPDRLDALASLCLPTLVIIGEEDLEFLPDSRRLAEEVPGARLAVIPGAGHVPQLEAKDAWWAALRSFLDEMGRRPSPSGPEVA